MARWAGRSVWMSTIAACAAFAVGCGGAAGESEDTRSSEAALDDSSGFPSPLPLPPFVLPPGPDGFAFAHVYIGGAVDVANSYNSRGGAITATETAYATYSVDIPNFGGNGANVQVVSQGYYGERCKVMNWGGSPSLRVGVKCNTKSNFIVFVTRQSAASGFKGAYLWHAGAGSAPLDYQFGSTGSPATVSPLGTGVYSVKLSGQSPSGNVQVTAYGGGDEYCKVASWLPIGPDTIADIRCFNALGLPADSAFSLLYSVTLPTAPGLLGGYAWAWSDSSPSYNASYTAPGSFPIPAGRWSTGLYHIDYPGILTANGAPLVTAYGTGPEHCQIVKWGWSAPGTNGPQVQIGCFKPSGYAIDTLYSSEFLATTLPPG